MNLHLLLLYILVVTSRIGGKISLDVVQVIWDSNLVLLLILEEIYFYYVI